MKFRCRFCTFTAFNSKLVQSHEIDKHRHSYTPARSYPSSLREQSHDSFIAVPVYISDDEPKRKSDDDYVGGGGSFGGGGSSGSWSSDDSSSSSSSSDSGSSSSGD